MLKLLTNLPAGSCGQPTRLPGSEAYLLSSTGYGSTFTFRCRASYFRLEGQSSLQKNSVVTCMGDGRWDFGDLRCIGASPFVLVGVAIVMTFCWLFLVVVTSMGDGRWDFGDLRCIGASLLVWVGVKIVITVCWLFLVVVTCMGDGRWDFGDLRCIGVCLF